MDKIYELKRELSECKYLKKQLCASGLHSDEDVEKLNEYRLRIARLERMLQMEGVDPYV